MSDGQLPFSLVVEVGTAKFNGSGREGVVQAAFERWLETVRPSSAAAAPILNGAGESRVPAVPPATNGTAAIDPTLISRMYRDDKDGAISLLAPPSNDEDCILLILLGHKLLRQESSVATTALMAGLKLTGRGSLRLHRIVSRIPNKIAASGTKKGMQYTLLNPGEQHATGALLAAFG